MEALLGGDVLALLGVGFLTLAVVAALLMTFAKPKVKPTTNAKSTAKKHVEAVVDHRSRCTILFGTQTGTAERFAKSLRSQLDSKYGANTAFDVVDIEHYDGPTRLSKERVVFLLLATYGDGEPTDNATDFYNWLVETADSADGDDLPLKALKFGVFGLGNRQYEHFCAVGKRVHKLMASLGATPLVAAGTGDDDRDIDEDFDTWSAQLFSTLDSAAVFKAGEATVLTADGVTSYVVEEVADAPAAAVDLHPNGSGLNHTSPYMAAVTAVRELHGTGSDRSCVHIEVDISGSKATYEAGDHIAVCAENAPEVVAAAAKALGLPLTACFRVDLPVGNPGGLPEPPAGPVTVRCILARYADLLSAPGKGALQALAAFASDPSQAATLKQLASIDGRDAYHEYIVAAKRSLLEVLQDFPSAQPSLGAFLGSIAPRLQPRFYSISSSPARHPQSVHITCAVVQEVMPTGRLHNGVASSWLAALTPGTKIPVFLRRSTFKLPADVNTPVVMVGPGTGLAPFRGFIQERLVAAKRAAALGPALLFFGCRSRQHDYIYREELEGAVAGGALSALHVAFSRETSVKDYVQHHMQRQGAEVWALLQPGANGVLYVCGDAKAMAKDVHRTLHDIIIKQTGCSGNEAEARVKALSDSGRYLKDVW